jgi:hypothetical protein
MIEDEILAMWRFSLFFTEPHDQNEIALLLQ